jgi:hypothetical protein
VPGVGGQGVREPPVDVALDVVAGAAGEQVPHGFVTRAGFGLPERAELAQRLELIGAGAAAAAASAASSARATSSVSGS